MFKNKFVNILVALAFVLAITGTALTPNPTSYAPRLALTVTKSPLAIYPPLIIYKAKLNPVPTTTTAQLKVDFYNLASTGTGYILLGSALLDRTGVATLSKQMNPGIYTAIARVVINTQVIWSNKVPYRVP